MKRSKTAAGLMCLGLSICFLWAGALRASDTDVYTGGLVNVPPNVLIIFDSSGSMSVEIFTGYATYNPSHSYSGSYTANRIYYKNGSQWDGLEKNVRCLLKLLGICLLTPGTRYT
jgi:hypothetical protein